MHVTCVLELAAALGQHDDVVVEGVLASKINKLPAFMYGQCTHPVGGIEAHLQDSLHHTCRGRRV